MTCREPVLETDADQAAKPPLEKLSPKTVTAEDWVHKAKARHVTNRIGKITNFLFKGAPENEAL
jgi:hypothetical protein